MEDALAERGLWVKYLEALFEIQSGHSPADIHSNSLLPAIAEIAAFDRGIKATAEQRVQAAIRVLGEGA
jgi:hypothetical protein